VDFSGMFLGAGDELEIGRTAPLEAGGGVADCELERRGAREHIGAVEGQPASLP
jgi:hypothetical protein